MKGGAVDVVEDGGGADEALMLRLECGLSGIVDYCVYYYGTLDEELANVCERGP